MKKIKVLFSIFLIFVLVNSLAQTPDNQAEKIKEFLPTIDKICKNFAEKEHLPSLVYGLVLNGQLVHSGSIGIINTSTKTVANNAAVYRIASMSKSFAAMAILQLRDAGKLRLDDPAYLYIPELKGQKFSEDSPEITIRHLLTHAAGFPEDNPWGDRQLAISDETMLKMFKKGISFSNTPGTAYEYSNMGFAMLGYIIKKVSGQSYQTYINQSILKPLGMINTYWDYGKVPQNQLVKGYRWLDENWVEQPMLGDGAYGAMGGMLTTMDDFAKYTAFHLSDAVSDAKESPVLKRSSLREMHQPWNISAFNTDNRNVYGKLMPFVSAYGYGLRWVEDADHKIGIGHSGGLPGFGSNWKILPAYKIGVIAFANRTYAPVSGLNVQILDTLVALAHLKPTPLPVSAVLKQRKNELMNLLPQWKNGEASGIFAENFFLDYFPNSLQKEAEGIFNKAGKILKINEIVPENNLRGTFILEGEHSNIEINFTLSPEKPALIQEYNIKEIKRLK
jgi:CubicO group peptidase (beta-lactamase class C family)